jgi:hypothetical protein
MNGNEALVYVGVGRLLICPQKMFWAYLYKKKAISQILNLITKEMY